VLNVLFIAPYFVGNTLYCMKLLAELTDVQLGVITHEPAERLPDRRIRHYQVSDCLDAKQLIVAGRAFQEEWGRVDRLLGFLEQMQLPNAVAREVLGIPGMKAAAARRFRDKNAMKSALREAGLPVARQRLLRSAEDALSFVEEVGYPIVVKPLAGLGSKATMRVSSQDELYGALAQLLPTPANPSQAEEFVQGSEHTFETVTISGQPVWSSTSYYLPGPLAVLENPWMQYCVLIPREQLPAHAAPFAPLNQRALAALGMHTGLSHMEWFIRPDGSPVISEVGARPPGVHLMPMMGLAHGVDMYEKWIRLMVYGTFTMPPRQHAVGCAFLRARGRGRVVRSVEGIEEAKARVGVALVDASLPRVGQPRTDHYEGEGWVIVRHRETQGVVDALRTLITTIQVYS
jgi:D-alanine-D-alanine ligase-like ATP-grasp enzyme